MKQGRMENGEWHKVYTKLKTRIYVFADSYIRFSERSLTILWLRTSEINNNMVAGSKKLVEIIFIKLKK